MAFHTFNIGSDRRAARPRRACRPSRIVAVLIQHLLAFHQVGRSTITHSPASHRARRASWWIRCHPRCRGRDGDVAGRCRPRTRPGRSPCRPSASAAAAATSATIPPRWESQGASRCHSLVGHDFRRTSRRCPRRATLAPRTSVAVPTGPRHWSVPSQANSRSRTASALHPCWESRCRLGSPAMQLHHEIAGSGDTIVLIHAGIADSRMWEPQWRRYAEDYQVVRYDMRGFGRSPLPPEPYQHAQDLLDLLDRFEIERAALVGQLAGRRRARGDAGPAATGHGAGAGRPGAAERRLVGRGRGIRQRGGAPVHGR